MRAEPIPAHQKQGSGHGFLLLKSEDGRVIGTGDLIQVAHGSEVRSRLVFHFRDGSIDDDVTVFRQEKFFQLVSDHHIQRGPSFPKPTDITVNALTGEVTSREMEGGKKQVRTEHVDLPADLANGMISLVLENISPKIPETKVSYLAGTPRPRVVTLSIKPEGSDTFTVGGVRHRADLFNIHVELGGVAGVIAPVVGKQPGDIQLWVVGDEVASFVRMEGPSYVGGPVWITEVAAPVWARDRGEPAH